MRYIEPFVREDLAKKMVLIGGPRQVGKATLAKHILALQTGRYFNWDYDTDRQAILGMQWADAVPLLVFDELPAGITGSEGLERLMQLGGFPEPFLENDPRNAGRWQRERLNLVLREDIRDLEPVRDIGNLVLLLDLLRSRVGGMLVIANLAGDLHVAPQSVKAWLAVFERMYLTFTVRPYIRSLPRAVLKPPKVYFFDNQDVMGDSGARFENLVAGHLLKRLHFEEDYEGRRCELHYIRDKEGRPGG